MAVGIKKRKKKESEIMRGQGGEKQSDSKYIHHSFAAVDMIYYLLSLPVLYTSMILASQKKYHLLLNFSSKTFRNE